MVSCSIHGENISLVGKPCFLFHFTISWARLRMGYLCPSFMRKSTIALCCICFVIAMHLMDDTDVIVSCMIIREPMCLLKALYGGCACKHHMFITERIVQVCMAY